MMRTRLLVLLVHAPLVACAQPKAEESAPAPDALPAEVAPVLPATDKRPVAGLSDYGDDVTELARAQNRTDPPLPTRRGSSRRTRTKPLISDTKDGYVALLPGANNVATPAYHRGRIYTGGYGTYDLHSINAETGESAWSLRLSDDGPTDPTCRDGICVFNTFSCTTFAVDAESGKELWSWYLGSPQLATPVIAGDVVYASYPDGSGPADTGYAIAAMDLKTGKHLWRRYIDGEVNSTPVAHKDSVYLATKVGTLYEFAAKDGTIKNARRNRIASPPVLAPSGILYGRAEQAAAADVIVAAETLFTHLEAMPAAREPIPQKPRPLVADSRLVTVDGETVVARDQKTGAKLWHKALPNDRAAEISAPLLYAGGSVLLATQSGSVLRINAETGAVEDGFSLGNPIASQPIAVSGWIYAGTQNGRVVAFDTGRPELTGWEMLGGTADRQGTVKADAEER
jgi:outer membrane protein assembly factor BamB